MVARKYELYRFVKLSHRIVGAQWDEEKGIWHVEVENLSSGERIQDWCDFIITASGILKSVHWKGLRAEIESANTIMQQLEMAGYPWSSLV